MNVKEAVEHRSTTTIQGSADIGAIARNTEAALG